MSWPSQQTRAKYIAEMKAAELLCRRRTSPAASTEQPLASPPPERAALLTVEQIVEAEMEAYYYVRRGDYQAGIKLLARCLEARYRLDLTSLPDGFGEVIELRR